MEAAFFKWASDIRPRHRAVRLELIRPGLAGGDNNLTTYVGNNDPVKESRDPGRVLDAHCPESICCSQSPRPPAGFGNGLILIGR